MSLIDKQLQEVWNALRADSPQRHDTLRAIRIKHLRGIRDLRVPFQYPVSVLAGPNGCGKSTVLFACACAYRDPERGTRELVPSSLFPNFVDPQRGTLSDTVEHTELEFDYVHGGEGYAMAWKRGKSWNRSFMGRKGGRQPERSLYLRTLAIWNALDQHAEDYAPVLGSTSADLKARMREIDRLGEGAVRQRHAARNGLFALSEELNGTVENVARIVARTETEANRGDMARFRIELGEQIDKWRQDAP